jgi:hypothetical protein
LSITATAAMSLSFTDDTPIGTLRGCFLFKYSRKRAPFKARKL